MIAGFLSRVLAKILAPITEAMDVAWLSAPWEN